MRAAGETGLLLELEIEAAEVSGADAEAAAEDAKLAEEDAERVFQDEVGGLVHGLLGGLLGGRGGGEGVLACFTLYEYDIVGPWCAFQGPRHLNHWRRPWLSEPSAIYSARLRPQ